MISGITNVLALRRMQKLLGKNQIEILHFIPGRIRLRSPLWTNEIAMRRLISEFEREAQVQSVTFTKETHSLLIEFDKAVMSELARIETWLLKLDALH